MNQKFTAITLLIFSMLLTVFVTQAQDFDNNPNTNSDANACYEGGTMADWGCDSLYYWIAGYIKIRLEYGLVTADQVPEIYEWLIDEEEIIADSDDNNSSKSSGVGCVAYDGGGYVNFGNSNVLDPFITYDLYSDKTCTTPDNFLAVPVYLVYAKKLSSAQSICDSVDFGTTAILFNGNRIYQCSP